MISAQYMLRWTDVHFIKFVQHAYIYLNKSIKNYENLACLLLIHVFLSISGFDP